MHTQIMMLLQLSPLDLATKINALRQRAGCIETPSDTRTCTTRTSQCIAFMSPPSTQMTNFSL
jgi:hypothetical protein